jgi:ubiquinone/menaquinone biosynthesis C-methylase UbiE
MSSRTDIVTNWDREYIAGAHWDTGKPSRHVYKLLDLIPPNSTILDAGCGAGRDVIFLSKLGYKIFGIDISKEAINLALTRDTESRQSKFILGSIEKIPIRDCFFDVAYSVYTAQRTEFSASFLEISRVLKNKGLLYLAMFIQTKYDKPCHKDLVISADSVLEKVSEAGFRIINETYNQYKEQDQFGIHKHKLLVVIARKL